MVSRINFRTVSLTMPCTFRRSIYSKFVRFIQRNMCVANKHWTFISKPCNKKLKSNTWFIILLALFCSCSKIGDIQQLFLFFFYLCLLPSLQTQKQCLSVFQLIVIITYMISVYFIIVVITFQRHKLLNIP